jgi:hypothetical protein
VDTPLTAERRRTGNIGCNEEDLHVVRRTGKVRAV